MTFQKIISKLNWRQIVIHFVAFWFLIYAFQTFSYLFFTNLIDNIRQNNGEFSKNYFDSDSNTENVTYFLIWTTYSGFIGILTAFIISIVMTLKRNWFWINSLIVFILTFILHRFDLLGWTFIKPVFYYIGQLLNDTTKEFWVNGIILLIIGLSIFFSNVSIKFIENKK